MVNRWGLSPTLVARSFLAALLVSLPLAGCISSASSASDVEPRDPTGEELEKFREHTYVDTSPESGTVVENFLFARSNEPPQSLAPSLSREFGLPLDAARHLVVGALIRGVTWTEEGEELAADLEESGSHLFRAVAIAPRSWVAVEELALFYGSGRRCRSAELIQIARDWGDLRDAALRLEPALSWTGCSEPLMTALGEHPNDLELIAALAQRYREGPFAIAIRQYARDVFVYGFGIVAPAVQVEIARSYIVTLLTSGAATAGVEAFEALPEPLRERVRSEAAASHPGFPLGYREIAASDRSVFQIELAAAYLSMGNSERASELLRDVAPEPHIDAKDSSESEAEDCVALLRASLGEAVADPYARLLDVGKLENDHEPSGCAHSRTWTRLIEGLAPDVGEADLHGTARSISLRRAPQLTAADPVRRRAAARGGDRRSRYGQHHVPADRVGFDETGRWAVRGSVSLRSPARRRWRRIDGSRGERAAHGSGQSGHGRRRASGDRLPHVARGSGDAERAAALAPALALMFGASFDAHVIPIDPGRKDPASELRYSYGIPASLDDEHTLFIVGRRSDFGPLDVGHRIVVMTPREAGFVRESRPVFFPTSIFLFVLDQERKRGLIIWSASWTGGRIRLTRRPDGTWKADPISRWIT